eukprot:6200011-Pleurochrysis_carterae.AAC.1
MRLHGESLLPGSGVFRLLGVKDVDATLAAHAARVRAKAAQRGSAAHSLIEPSSPPVHTNSNDG